jgi:hypothetical protein
MMFLIEIAPLPFLAQFDCEELVVLMGKVFQAYLTGHIGSLSRTHILHHIFRARKPNFTRSEVHLGWVLFFRNVSASFPFVLKV